MTPSTIYFGCHWPSIWHHQPFLQFNFSIASWGIFWNYSSLS